MSRDVSHPEEHLLPHEVWEHLHTPVGSTSLEVWQTGALVHAERLFHGHSPEVVELVRRFGLRRGVLHPVWDTALSQWSASAATAVVALECARTPREHGGVLWMVADERVTGSPEALALLAELAPEAVCATLMRAWSGWCGRTGQGRGGFPHTQWREAASALCALGPAVQEVASGLAEGWEESPAALVDTASRCVALEASGVRA